MRAKHAQAWGVDLMIALIIFSVGIAVFYFYALNEPSEAKTNIENLIYDGNFIAKILLSEGSPEDWNSENVISLGILSENKINETKLENFYNLAEADYPKTKKLFNTRYDYYFFLSEDMIIGGDLIEGIGSKSENYENLVKITRLTIYKNKPVTCYLWIYEK